MMRAMRPWTARSLAFFVPLACALAACDGQAYREVALAPAPAPAAPLAAARPARTLRFSVAAVESPRDTYATYSRLFERVGQRLGMRIELVQRRTYREVNELLAAGQLDAALLCTGGYIDLERRAPGSVEVLAAPLLDGRPTYESVVIVPASSAARSLAELAGARFAFTDELSFSGHAYVRRAIADLGRDPERFFGSTIYTQNHDRSIAAVASGLVDGAAVHGFVLEHLLRSDPALRSRVRVLHRSPAFGAMPLVVSTRLDPGLRARVRDVLLALSDDAEGVAALRALEIDGFVSPPPGLYDSAKRVFEVRR